MERNRSSISQAGSYREIGEYWDAHDLSESWGKTRKVTFDVRIESEITYCAVERDLSEKVRSIAKRQGVSTDTLINFWIQQKIQGISS